MHLWSTSVKSTWTDSTGPPARLPILFSRLKSGLTNTHIVSVSATEKDLGQKGKAVAEKVLAIDSHHTLHKARDWDANVPIFNITRMEFNDVYSGFWFVILRIKMDKLFFICFNKGSQRFPSQVTWSWARLNLQMKICCGWKSQWAFGLRWFCPIIPTLTSGDVTHASSMVSMIHQIQLMAFFGIKTLCFLYFKINTGKLFWMFWN